MRNNRYRLSHMIRQSVAAFLLMAGVTGTHSLFAEEVAPTDPVRTETAIAAARTAQPAPKITASATVDHAQAAPLSEAEKTIVAFVSSNDGPAWVDDIKKLQRAVNEVCGATPNREQLDIDGAYGPKTNTATADCLAQKPSLAQRIGTRLMGHMNDIKDGVKVFAEKLAQSPASMNSFLSQLNEDVANNKNVDLRVVLGQQMLHAAQTNPGKIDGLWGRDTTKAFAEWKNNPRVVAALQNYLLPETKAPTHEVAQESTAAATSPAPTPEATTMTGVRTARENLAAQESTAAATSPAPTHEATTMTGVRTAREGKIAADFTAQTAQPAQTTPVSGNISSINLDATGLQKMARMLSPTRLPQNFYAELRSALIPLVPDAKLDRIDPSPTNAQKTALREQLIRVIKENPMLVTSIGQGLYRELVDKPALMSQLGSTISHTPDVMRKLRESAAQKGATLAQRGLLFAAISNDDRGGPAVLTAIRAAEKAGKTLTLEDGLRVFDKAISSRPVKMKTVAEGDQAPSLQPRLDINPLSVLSENSYTSGSIKSLSTLVGDSTGANSINTPSLLDNLEAYLTANPAAFGYVGTGITQTLKATGRYTHLVGSLANKIRANPDVVLDIGAGLAVTKQSAGILADALSAIQNRPVQLPAVNNADEFESLYAQTVRTLFPNQTNLSTALSSRTNVVGSAGSKNVRAIEAFLRVSKPNGFLSANEKTGLMNHIKDNPSALMTIDYSTTQTIIDQKLFPLAVSVLAGHLKNQPEEIELYGAAMIAAQRNGADSYLFEAALAKLKEINPPVRLEAGKGRVLRMSPVLAAQQTAIFKKYGQVGPHYEKNPDGTIKMNEVGRLLANFTPPKATVQRPVRKENKKGNHTAGAQATTTALTGTIATDLTSALRAEGITIVGEKPTSRALANGMVAYFVKNPQMLKAISENPTAANNILGFIHASAGLSEQMALASQPSFKEMVTADFVRYGASIAQSIQTSTNGTFTIAPLPTQLAAGVAIATTTSIKKGSLYPDLSSVFLDSAASVLPAMAAGLPGRAADVVDNALRVFRDALAAKPAAAPSTISDLQKRFPAAPSELVVQVSNICTQYGVNPAYVLTLMRIETGNTFNPNVKNQQPGQSAFGLAQYTELTFSQSYARYAKNLPPEKQGIVDREQLLALRSDPEVVTHLVCSETKDNGIADGARAYLAGHFLGSPSLVTAIYNQAQLERNAPVIDPSSITTGSQLFQMRQRVLAETGLIPPNFVAANPNTFNVPAQTFVDVYTHIFSNAGASNTFSSVSDPKGQPWHRVSPMNRDPANSLQATAQPLLARISAPAPSRVSTPPAVDVASVAATANGLAQNNAPATVVGYSLVDRSSVHTTLVASWERLATISNPVVVIYETPTRVVQTKDVRDVKRIRSDRKVTSYTSG